MSSELNIDRIARLARLKLTDDEKQKLAPQLAKIVDYIDLLGELDTSDVEPTAHILPVQNVFREDDPVKNFPEADYLSLAPKPDKGHYEVPKIIG